jgi:hypothetical protein
MIGVSADDLYDGLTNAADDIVHKASLGRITLVPEVDERECIVESISDKIISLMLSGGFLVGELPNNEFCECMKKCLKVTKDKQLKDVQKLLEKVYKKKTEKKAVEIVVELYTKEFISGVNVSEIVKDFSVDKNKNSAFAEEVELYLKNLMKKGAV